MKAEVSKMEMMTVTATPIVAPAPPKKIRMTKPHPLSYPSDFRANALDLAARIGASRSSKLLNISPASIYLWRRKYPELVPHMEKKPAPTAILSATSMTMAELEKENLFLRRVIDRLLA